MSNLLKDFEVASKNPSLEARQRWRSSVGLVKNRARRFRMISNLDKLAENEKKRCQIQVCCFLLPSLFSVSVNLLISTTVFDHFLLRYQITILLFRNFFAIDESMCLFAIVN
ncbi:putative calcium-transporting P-type ATPase autoinhibitory domain-containing protein [Arabidopsis thaliana]